MRAWFVRALVAAIALALLVMAFVSVRPLARDSKVCPDFIQFWTAATLISSGHSPYDPAGQASVQRALGWRKDVEGLGRYEFLPYYYPPWLALACEALLPLGYLGARAAWLLIDAAALLAAAFLLKDVAFLAGTRDTAPTSARPSPLTVAIFVVFFAPAVIAVLMGQVSPLLLVAIAGAWTLLERKRDFGAGVLLAWLTIKPQLTIILIVALLAWCLRRHRWRVAGGFAVALGGLMIVSSLIVPSWLPQMINATRVTELPSRAFPWTGASAYSILHAVGLQGPALSMAYLVVALPVIAVVARATLDRRSRLADLFGVGLLAPFFVATYARHYDFPILLVPALILVSEGTRRYGAALLVALLVLPYLHLAAFPGLAAVCGMPEFPGPQLTYFWIPLLIGAAWFIHARRMQPEALPKESFRVS